jgi:hypothetical protein
VKAWKTQTTSIGFGGGRGGDRKIFKGGDLQTLARETVRSFKVLREVKTRSKDGAMVKKRIDEKRRNQNSSCGKRTEEKF